MAKLSKEDAQYTETPTKGQGRCRNCTMARDGAHVCTAVVGPIHPHGHCRLFERKEK